MLKGSYIYISLHFVCLPLMILSVSPPYFFSLSDNLVLVPDESIVPQMFWPVCCLNVFSLVQSYQGYLAFVLRNGCMLH